MATPSDPLIGRTLDQRYRIESIAARGGMATVYMASDLRLQRVVAIKVMHPDLATDPGFVERFVRESRATAALAHPHVVAVHDQGQDSATGAVYLVMELVSGHTLRDVLSSRGALSVAQALAVIDPVLLALAAAHRAGFIHRDVKPENVLIADNGQVKVADFGLARALYSGDTKASTKGVLIGTAAYLSPEQVATGRADARSDVYAAGVMLFEMLTGQLPHSGETPIALAFQHVHSDVPAPSSIKPGLPAALDRIVARATNRDPALRYQNVEQFISEVRTARVQADGYQAAEDWQQTDVIEAGSNHQSPTAALIESKPRKVGRWIFATISFLIAIAAWWFTVGNRVTVPQLVGMPVTKAEQSLADSELRSNITRVYSEEVAVDVVISAEPASGSSVSKKTLIQLTVSKGPEKVQVPNLTGVELNLALTQLAESELTAGSQSTQYSDTIAKGNVISSDPAVDEKLKRGAKVNLVISKGPEPIAVPIVVGKSREVAEQLLAVAGFVNVKLSSAHSETVPAGKVISVSPKAGEMKAATAKIELIVSDGPPPVKIPSVLGMTWKKAAELLTNAKLKYSIVWQNTCAPKKVVNTFVVSQSPDVGALVARLTTIKLVIAKACSG